MRLAREYQHTARHLLRPVTRAPATNIAVQDSGEEVIALD